MQHVKSGHDMANHFVPVELRLEGVKIVHELKPWWKLVILDPPNAFVVLRNLRVESGLQAIHKCGEHQSQTIGKRVGLAD